MFFQELFCFFDDPTDVGNLISSSSDFSKSNFNIWKFMVHVLLKPSLENFEHYFASLWDECNCEVVWAFFGIAFLGIGMKTDLFQSCSCCWVFQIFWHIECSTFTVSSFRTWNSSPGIPSPPLALFAVMLPKVHLTFQSRMSSSRWMITPSWLFGSWRYFLYSSVYSCHLFLISSAFVRSIPFLSFIVSIFAWNIPLVSLIFLKRSLVFPILLFSYFFALITEESFISPRYLLNSAFKWVYLFFSPLPFASLLFSAIFKPSSDNCFAFLHFFFLGMVLITVSCTMSWTSVHSSSGTLSISSNPLNLSLQLYNCKEFALGHPKRFSDFPYFLQFKSEFGNEEFMVWAIVSSWSCFCWLYSASLWLQRI